MTVVLNRTVVASLLDDLLGDEGLTCMTRLDWPDREAVDVALWELASGSSLAQVSQLVGYSKSTVFRWRERSNEF